MLNQIELSNIASEAYEARGILPSEMALIIHTMRKHKIELVIESGRARGQSTYMLGKYLPNVKIISLETLLSQDELFARERLRSFQNVTLLMADSKAILPKIVNIYQDKRIGILLDGPKGEKAVNLLQKTFEYPNVIVGFIHDMRKLDNGKPSPHRAAALEKFPDCRFSDDPRIIKAASWMDEKARELGASVGPEHEAIFGSYGPTLGVFLNRPGNKGGAIRPQHLPSCCVEKQTATSERYDHDNQKAS